MGLNHGWRGPNIVRDGLVLYLDAGSPNSYQGSGTTWKDISKVNQNNGTLINGPTFSSGNGGSIVFDGIDDYVDIPNNSVLFPQNQITLEIFIKTITTPTGRIVATELNDFTTPYLLYFKNNKFSFFLSTNSPNSFIELVSNITINSSSYYHVVATYDRFLATSQAKIYINGSLNIQSSYSNPIYDPGVNGYLYLMGSNYRNIKQFFAPGNLPVVRIYNRALTPSEVLQNYNATKGRFGL